MDSILKKRISESGLAALGLALIMKPLGELPTLFTIALVGLVGEPVDASFVLPALVAGIAAIVGGFVLMRRFVARTDGWFVAAILTWLFVGFLFSALDVWVSTLLIFVVTWFEMYLSNAPVKPKPEAGEAAAPAEEIKLFKNETPVSPVEAAADASTDAQPLDAGSVSAAINAAPGNPLFSALGLVGAILGGLLVLSGLMDGASSAIDALGDSFSGLPRSTDQGSSGATTQILLGVILVGIGITVYTLFKGPKKAK